jgi:hypothetical protein
MSVLTYHVVAGELLSAADLAETGSLTPFKAGNSGSPPMKTVH